MTLGRDPRTCEGQVRVRHQGNDGDVEDLREEHLVLRPGETLRPTHDLLNRDHVALLNHCLQDL